MTQARAHTDKKSRDTLRLAVKKSPIHGKGLFAASLIRKGALIGVYKGPRSRQIGDHVLWVEDEEGQEYGIDGKNRLRYVNHAVKPNACFYGEELYALRSIKAGEEITHHYGDEWQ